MRRAVRLVAVLGAVTLMGAGYGGTALAGGDKPLEGEEIEVAAVWTGTEEDRFTKVLERFEKNTGADVTFTSTGDDISAALEPRIAGGDPPDVAILPQPGLLAEFADRGALQPIEDLAGSEIDENYAPIWRQLGSADGTLYGVWFKAANKSLVWYRPDVFEDAGVKPPKSFDEFLDVAQTVSDSGVDPFAVGGANGWTLTDAFENIYLAQAGPERYDQLARHEIPWTDPSVIQALETMAQLLDGDFVSGGADGALQTEFPESVQTVFADEDAAMVISADFAAGVITGETDARIGRDAKIFRFPAIAGSDPPVVTAGDVAVLMTDNPAAQQFIAFLATPQAAAEWAEEGGFISPNGNVKPKAYPDKVSRQIAAQLVGSENLRFDLSDLQPAEFGATDGQGMWKIFQDFLENPDDVNGTAQQLEEAATQANVQG